MPDHTHTHPHPQSHSAPSGPARALRLGVCGPVRTGTSSLIALLCRGLASELALGVVPNDTSPAEDAPPPRAPGAPPPARGAFCRVHRELDPLDAAEAGARDDTSRVAEWLATGRLRKPTDDETKAWGEAQETAFEFLIVQPFVLARRVARAAA